MAYSIVWPGTLPANANDDYSESGGVLTLSTPMDAGPAKTRRRGAASAFLQVTFTMTTAQVAIFEGFVKDTLLGVKRFGFPHPRKAVLVEGRLKGSSEGKLYDIRGSGFDSYDVSFEVEVLP